MKKRLFIVLALWVLVCMSLAACGAASVTVTYDLNYPGSSPQAVTLTKGQTPEELAVQREGYELTGWFTDAACTEDSRFRFDRPLDEDLTLYAGWREKQQPRECALTFSIGEGQGSVPEAITAFSGTTVTLPVGEDLTRDKYGFTGWDDGESVYQPGAAYVVKGDIKLTAVWTRLYRLTFSMGSGTGTPPQPVEILKGESYSLPEAEGAPQGYTYYGWKDALNGTVYRKGEALTVEADLTLIALWGGLYTATFTGAETDLPAVQCRTGETIVLPDYAGEIAQTQEFVGWEYAGKIYAAGERFEMPAEDVAFAARMNRTGYLVRFVDWDGWLLEEIAVPEGGTVSEPPQDVLGKIAEFSGWDQSLSDIRSDITVTAVYSLEFSPKSNFTFTLNRNKNGYLISKSGNFFPQDGNLVIPATYSGLPVREISANSFEGTSVKSLYVPSSVTVIGAAAFKNCGNLVRVGYSDAPKVKTIAESAFESCKLGEILIPASVSSVGRYSYQNNVSATSLTFGTPSSLKSLGGWTFANCSSLTSVDLPEGLEMTTSSEFYHCSALERAAIPSTLIKLSDFCFSGCKKLAKVTFAPNGALDEIGYAGTGIGNGGQTFFGTALTEITLPAGLKVIRYKTFSGCKSLESVIFDGNSQLERIEQQAFETCHSLSRFNSNTAGHFAMPESLISIGDCAFCSNSELASITFGSQLTRIGEFAFSAWNPKYYSGVGEIDHDVVQEEVIVTRKNVFPNKLQTVTIPKSVVDIGERAFFRCESLTQILVESGNTAYRSVSGALFSADGKNLICVPAGFRGALAIPEGCETISPYAAYKTLALTEVTIPASVNAIGEYAFAGSKQLAGVAIDPEIRLEAIDDYAFVECVCLESFALPRTVKTIGEGAFYNCSSLVEFTIPVDSALETIGNYSFGASYGYELRITSFTLPDTVVEIGVGAFSKTAYLTQFEIRPTSQLSKINYGAFSGSGITSVFLPASLESMETLNSNGVYSSYAFEFCKNLAGVTFAPDGKLRTIGYGAFHSSGLASLQIPSYITSIAGYAFTSTKLTSIVIPETVTQIGRYAFYDCQELVSADILAPVTKFEIHTFSACPKLQQVNLPQTLREIGNYSFNSCQSLTAIALPASVVSIGLAAFGESGLAELTMQGAVPPSAAGAFGSNETAAPLTVIYVPAGKLTAYRNAQDWKAYEAIMREYADEVA